MISDFAGKKVLVTGGAGFIGSHTVDALLRKGASVVVVDDLSTGKEGNINLQAVFYNVNMASVEFEKILEKEKPDIVYHFAWFVCPHHFRASLIQYVDSIVGSIRLMEKLKNIGVEKVVFSSSGFLYGEARYPPAKEHMSIEMMSAYSVAKFAVENSLSYFNDVHNVPSVILRYSTVFGIRQSSGAVADYVRQLSEGRQAEIYGDGEASRDYIHVSDIVRANLLAPFVSNDVDPVFNVSTKIGTSLNSMYRKIANLLHRDFNPIYRPARSSEIRNLVLNNSKIQDCLGWEPKVSIDEGLSLYLGTTD